MARWDTALHWTIRVLALGCLVCLALDQLHELGWTRAKAVESP